MAGKNEMTQSAAANIQSTQAKSGGDMGFASRAQSAGDKNANAGTAQNQGSGSGSGTGQGKTGSGGAPPKK